MEGSPIVDPLACRHLYVLVSSKEKHTIAALEAPWHAFQGVAPLVPCGANNHLLRDGHLSFTRLVARSAPFSVTTQEGFVQSASSLEPSE